jgi:hypothetical protein
MRFDTLSAQQCQFIFVCAVADKRARSGARAEFCPLADG